jgi:uncharacterized protein with LGFP repeats
MKAQVTIAFWGDGGEVLMPSVVGPTADASFSWTNLLGSLISAAKDFFSGGWGAIEGDLKKLYDGVSGDVGDTKTLSLSVSQGGSVPGLTVPASRAQIYFHAWTGDDIKASFGRVIPDSTTIVDLGESRFTRGDFQYEYRFDIPLATVQRGKYAFAFGTGDSGTIQDAAIGYTVQLDVGQPIGPVPSIDERWARFGGAKGWLGDATAPEAPTAEDYGFGRWRPFTNGRIYWTPGRGAREVHGMILGKYQDLGFEHGFLRLPLTDELGTPDGMGRFNHFEGGSIYWTPDLGAHEVHGGIRALWASLGWERGWLGYPVTDETQLPDASRVNNFQSGSIRWTPRTGAIASQQVLPI